MNGLFNIIWKCIAILSSFKMLSNMDGFYLFFNVSRIFRKDLSQLEIDTCDIVLIPYTKYIIQPNL